jgi:hypothetical protein
VVIDFIPYLKFQIFNFHQSWICNFNHNHLGTNRIILCLYSIWVQYLHFHFGQFFRNYQLFFSCKLHWKVFMIRWLQWMVHDHSLAFQARSWISIQFLLCFSQISFLPCVRQFSCRCWEPVLCPWCFFSTNLYFQNWKIDHSAINLEFLARYLIYRFGFLFFFQVFFASSFIFMRNRLLFLR